MNHRIAVGLFFTGYLLLGFGIVDDYGITFDEAIQRRHGIVTVEYIAEQLGIEHESLLSGERSFAPYGMAYQMVATPIEMRLDYEEDPYRYYRVRHILNFLLFGLALGLFYQTLRLRWPYRTWWPMLGTAVLLLTPRIFAHAFFNPKDHILLVAYVAATYTLVRYLHRRSWGALVWHALATGVAISTRPPGLLLLAATVALLLGEQLFTRPPDRRGAWHALAFVPAALVAALPFLPYLWGRIGSAAGSVVAEMANYDWGGEVLLFGTYYAATDVPWFYVPSWIGVTTPPVYLLFILGGIILAGFGAVRALIRSAFWNSLEQKTDALLLGLALLPVLTVIVLHATLYNGWRHLHFIYPALVYLAVLGFDRAYRCYPRIAAGTLAAGLVVTAVTMVRMHPLQQVYFNELAGDDLLQRYDMDYWGAGYREAFLQLAAMIPEGEKRSVHCLNWPCEDNLYALPPEAKRKLVLQDAWHLSDYIATNYAFPTEKVAVAEGTEYFTDPVVELRPEGQLVIGIYKVVQ